MLGVHLKSAITSPKKPSLLNMTWSKFSAVRGLNGYPDSSEDLEITWEEPPF